jgi:hypothetical protein
VFDDNANPRDVDLQTEIINSGSDGLTNVGVFANEYVRDYMLDKLAQTKTL